MTGRSAVAPRAAETGTVVARPSGRAGRRRFAGQVAAAAGFLAVVLAVGAAGLLSGPDAGAERPRAARTLAGAATIAAVRPAAHASATQPVEGVLRTHAATEAALQAAAQAAAVAAAQRASALAPHTGVNWDGIASCETGGNWGMRGSSFSGGLGFANSTWRSFGGGEFAPNAGMASREQQIAVAERVYARYGLSGWGCRRYG